MHGTLDQNQARARVVDVRHVVLPDCEIARAAPVARETIAQFLDRQAASPAACWLHRDDRRRWHSRLPTTCWINGRPVLRKAWRKTRIRAGDVVVFVSRPGKATGGGGKQIAGLVALIALSALSGGIAGAILGPELAGTALIGTVTYGQALGAAIVLGGSLAIATLVAPKPAAQPSADPLGQVYSLAAAGNLARLLQPRPVPFGRLKRFPDFAATPFHEYVDNDQYLNVLLNLGEGKYFLEAMHDSDTVIWTEADGYSPNFSDIQFAQYNPGENVTLIPTNVVESSEVTGQELGDPATEPNSGWVGGFAATASGVEATALAVDVAFPAGLFHTNDNGALSAMTVPLACEYRPIDAAGAPTGSFTALPGFPHDVTMSARQPQRLTFKADVTAGRYEVRMRRTNAPAADTGSVDTVVWIGLRAFIHGPSSFPCSILAIRARATNQFSSSRSFGVIATRILPVWDGDEFVEQPTRNPYWALYDALTNDDYGAGRPPSKVDFQNIVDGAAAAAARGDTFDYEFRSTVQVPQALDTILGATRAKHRWSGDVVSSFRDEWQEIPRLMLTDREIVRGSLEVNWDFMPEDTADAVVMQYLDETTWRPAEVQYPPNSESFTAVNPATRQIPGIVNRDQANREAAFVYLQSLYRRIKVTLSTEHDGRLLLLGSAVLVQTELPLEFGQSGRVAGNAGGTLTLDPAPSWPSGTHYISIRTVRGKAFGPILCARGANDALAVLDADDLDQVEDDQSMTLAEALARPAGAEEASFAIGTGDSVPRLCQVLSGRPSGDRVQLNLVVDDQRVHTTDIDSPPTVPSLPGTLNPIRPVIAGLYAVFRQSVAEATLDARWQPARGAVSYKAAVSYDGGVSWAPIYEGTDTGFSRTAAATDLRLRVQAFGVQGPGPFTTVDVTAPIIAIQQISLEDQVRQKIAQGRAAFLALDSQAGPALPTKPADPARPEEAQANVQVSTEVWSQLDRIKSVLFAHVVKLSEHAHIFRDAEIIVDRNSGRVQLLAVQRLAKELGDQLTEIGITLDSVAGTLTEKASLTYVNSALSGLAAGFSPAYAEQFNNTAGGWTAYHCTITNGPGYIDVQCSDVDAYIQSPALSVDADANPFFGVNIQQLTGTGWGVSVKWGASYVNEALLDTPLTPTDPNLVRVIAGDNPGWTGTLTSVRLRLGESSADKFRIDSVEISSNPLQQLLSESAGSIIAQINEVTSTLSAVLASLEQKASSLIVTAQGEVLTTALNRLDGLDALVESLAAVSDLDEVADTITTLINRLNAKDAIQTDIIEKIQGPPNTLRATTQINDILDRAKQNADLRFAIAQIRRDAQVVAESSKEALTSIRDQAISRIGNNEASIVSEATTRAAADAAEATQRETLAAQVAANGAAITTEATARASGDSALASSLSAVSATAASNTAAIATEATARANADSAEATARAAVAADVASNAAAIATEATARADGDSAEAAAREALSATVDDNTAAITTEQSARASGDSTQASVTAALSVAVDDNTAAIATEATARADADSAMATEIDEVSAANDDNAAAVTEIKTAMVGSGGDVSAFWGFRLNVDGRITGIVQKATADETDLAIVTDNFFLFHPDVNGGADTAFLSAVTIGPDTFWKLTGFVQIDNASIKDLTADNINSAYAKKNTVSFMASTTTLSVTANFGSGLNTSSSVLLTKTYTAAKGFLVVDVFIRTGTSTQTSNPFGAGSPLHGMALQFFLDVYASNGTTLLERFPIEYFGRATFNGPASWGETIDTVIGEDPPNGFQTSKLSGEKTDLANRAVAKPYIRKASPGDTFVFKLVGMIKQLAYSAGATQHITSTVEVTEAAIEIDEPNNF